MIIKQIEVHNFKSFGHFKIDLGNLNILVGPNAAGKSNFIRVFKFLRNIVRYNLNDAISIEGGVEHLRNIGLGNNENLRFRIQYDPEARRMQSSDIGQIGIKLYDATYEFEIRFHKRGKGFAIIQDSLAISYRFVKLEPTHTDNFGESLELGTGLDFHSLQSGKLKSTLTIPDSIPLDTEQISPLSSFQMKRKLPKNTLLLETPFFELAHGWLLNNDFGDIAIYDFDPRLPQKSVSVTGKAELEEDGSNLSLILNKILADKEDRRRLLNLTTELLEFVNDFRVQKLTDKSLLFSLQEKYSSETFLPAYLLSDGTISIIALIIALYFEDRPLMVLEELERNIHPNLIRRVVEMLQEVSENKQIFVTTHNPEMVKYAQLEELIFISRDKDGFSVVSHPAERENVKIFLENEIGVEDLFVDNLLGV
ncbi:MAG: AAA family ATPase [Chloroflexi bacterium]|nr:AAA family ATPase [Chloroflexota bacterium]